MAISRISAASAQAASVAITTPAAGDVILVCAHRDGNVTPPTLAAGYVQLATQGANLNSAILAYLISAGTETTTGTWTNATSIACVVYRGADVNCPFGDIQPGAGSSTTLSYTALTLHLATGTAWVVGFGAHNTATNVGSAPTNMTLVSSATDIAVSDTNAAVSAWSTQTKVVNANAGWSTYTVELRVAATPTAPSPDPLVWYKGSSEVGAENSNAIKCHFPQRSLPNNFLWIAFTHATGGSVTSLTDSNSVVWTAGPTITNVNTNRDVRLYYRANAAPADYVIVTFAAATANFEYQMGEFKGVKTTSPVDGTATGAATATLPITSGSITTTVPGDLLLQVAFDCQQVFGNNNSQLYGAAPHPGFVILGCNMAGVYAAQYGIQAAAGAINPGIDVLQPSFADTFGSLTLALKIDGSGTAPTGMRIVHEYTHATHKGAVEPIQFPTQGNLILVATTVPNNQSVLSAATDLQGNVYTRKNLDTITGQLLYAKNATPSLTMRLTVTMDAAGYYTRLYDVIGADPNPYDAEAWATNSIGAAGDVIDAPVITPGSVSGMTLCIIAVGTGPFTTFYAPSGAVTDIDPYTGETDASNLNFGDTFGHLFYFNAATQAWNAHTNVPGVTSWAAQAHTFKAAPILPILGRIPPLSGIPLQQQLDEWP